MSSLSIAEKWRRAIRISPHTYSLPPQHFQFAYNTGAISAPEMIIKDFLSYMLDEKSDDPPSLQSLSVAIFSVGGMIGSSSVGPFVNHSSSHDSMFRINLLAVFSGYPMGYYKITKSVKMLILGHFAAGLFCRPCAGIVTV